jgi:hypothetical protein
LAASAHRQSLCPEEAFDIDIKDDDIERLGTVEQAMDCVERRLSARSPGRLPTRSSR